MIDILFTGNKIKVQAIIEKMDQSLAHHHTDKDAGVEQGKCGRCADLVQISQF